mgnify:CR=1 FL=1
MRQYGPPERKGPKRFLAVLAVLCLLAIVFERSGMREFFETRTAETTQQQSSPPPPREITDGDISIVTWNIEWFPGGSSSPTESEEQEHMGAVQAAIREIDADVYLLQEMRDMEVVEELFSGLPGYEVHIVSRFRQGFGIGPMQLAVASRLPARAAFTEGFVENDRGDDPPRGFAFAALQLPDERTLLAYSVHLKANPG